MITFTAEEFKDYEFRCESASANTGFKHVCKVYKEGELIEECTSVVNWGNRTWESYQYATVFEDSKSKLQSLLDGHKEPEIDFTFLNNLVCQDVITDWGELESGEVVIMFDTWEQVEGTEEREWVEGEGMQKTGKFTKSPYAKLKDLAEKNLLKPSAQYIIDNIEYVFTDQFMKCDECGTLHDYTWGDLTYDEEDGLMLCDKCINSPDRVATLIESAKEDMRSALKPTIDQSIIESLGYTLVTEETFSFEREFWGALYMSEKYADDFIHKHGGFIQIYEVAQFVTPFQIWIPNSKLECARNDLKNDYEAVTQ